MAVLTYQSNQVTNSSTFNNTVVVTKPVSLAVGDLMIGRVWGDLNTIVLTPPSGFISIVRTNNYTGGANMASEIFYKIADAGDVAAANFTFNLSGSSSRKSASITRFTNPNTSSVYSMVSTYASPSAGDTITIPTVTPTYGNSVFMFFQANVSLMSCSGYAFANDNPTFTEVYDGGSLSFYGSMAYALRGQSTATGNATATITGSYYNIGQLLVLNPSPVPQTINETFTLTETINYKVKSFFNDVVSVLETITSTKGRLWRSLTKPITTWRNRQK